MRVRRIISDAFTKENASDGWERSLSTVLFRYLKSVDYVIVSIMPRLNLKGVIKTW